MKDYRVTYVTNRGTVYSERDMREEIETGRWDAPFPNKEGDSLAFGLVEYILQSDECPPALREEKIVTVIVSES
jgi:hypothetical protein